MSATADHGDNPPVYVTSGGANKTLHLDRDCRYLRKANRVVGKRLAMFPDPDFCQVCAGGME